MRETNEGAGKKKAAAAEAEKERKKTTVNELKDVDEKAEVASHRQASDNTQSAGT